MNLSIERSKGFSALGLIGAVSIGSILSLGYINLSHYLIAENALEQATRLAIRCVSPTNGNCSSLAQTTGKPRWKYTASVLSPRGDFFSEEVDYSAKIFRERYTAQTPYFSISQESPPKVQLTTFTVPTARFREIQQYKKVDLTFQYQGLQKRVFAEPKTPAFPVFDSKFEDEHDTVSFATKVSYWEPMNALQGSQLLSFYFDCSTTIYL